MVWAIYMACGMVWRCSLELHGKTIRNIWGIYGKSCINGGFVRENQIWAMMDFPAGHLWLAASLRPSDHWGWGFHALGMPCRGRTYKDHKKHRLLRWTNSKFELVNPETLPAKILKKWSSLRCTKLQIYSDSVKFDDSWRVLQGPSPKKCNIPVIDVLFTAQEYLCFVPQPKSRSIGFEARSASGLHEANPRRSTCGEAEGMDGLQLP